MKKFFAKFSTKSQNTIKSENTLDVDYNFYCSNAITSNTNFNTWNPEFASDPSAWENVFLKCWSELKSLLLNINLINIEMLNKVFFFCFYSNAIIFFLDV